jgi:hypothetical protein
MRPALFTPRRLAAAILAGLAALASPGSARAAFVADSTVNIKSTTPAYGAGTFTGTVAVDNVDATHSTVRISLTNTTSSEYITALGFSLPSGLSSASLSASPSSSWQLLGASSGFVNNSAFDTGYFGAFDIGASIGSTWHTPSGTNPTSGIAAGQTGTFEFTMVGTGAAVTAQSLLTYLSTNSSAGIGVRFRNAGDMASALTGGVNGGKVLAVKDYTPPPGGQVPAPPAVLLALAGVGTCLLGRGFRRRVAVSPTA